MKIITVTLDAYCSIDTEMWKINGYKHNKNKEVHDERRQEASVLVLYVKEASESEPECFSMAVFQLSGFLLWAWSTSAL